MTASMKINLSALDRLAEKINSKEVIQEIEKLPEEKAIIAMVAQSIAENFQQEGPGWAPLKPQTIRQSVAKSIKKKLSKLTNSEVSEYEHLSRVQNKTKQDELRIAQLNVMMKNKKPMLSPNRRILRKSGLLMKSVTVPGAQHNITRKQGTSLIWGTDVVYAGTHNYGTQKVPQREFLVIKKHWQDRISQYVVGRLTQAIKRIFS